MNSGSLIKTALCVTLSTFLLTGCSTPSQSRQISKTGFLADYPHLKMGEKGESKLLYINSSADFRLYKKVIVEPVSVWVQKDSNMHKLPQEELQALVDYLDATIRENLREQYEIVTEPAPDAMRLRVAITDGKKSKVLLNTFSSIAPPALLVSMIKRAAVGTHTAVGEAAIEAELLDSISGVRLMAASDSRAGRKSLVSGNFSQWGDTKDAFDFWAQKLGSRLTELSEHPKAL